MELFTLHGKVAIVTGALGLLGREHCESLARAGAHVVALDLDAAGCEQFARELSARERVECIGAGADITHKAELERVRAHVLERFGGIHALINNAALDDKVPANGSETEANPRTFEHFPEALFRRSLEVNVTGTFLCCQVFGSHMAEQRAGSIVNVASTYALVGPDQRLYREPERAQQRFFKSAAYPTSKGALLALTRFLAAYWGPAHVRVNALCPGGVQTDQPEHFVHAYRARTPLARMARADDYHGAVVFLASDASSYMTGATLVVDGGFTAW